MENSEGTEGVEEEDCKIVKSEEKLEFLGTARAGDLQER